MPSNLRSTSASSAVCWSTRASARSVRSMTCRGCMRCCRRRSSWCRPGSTSPAEPLVGVARTLTDFAWCAYLSDLAVVRAAQGLGIGKGLLDATRAHLGPRVALILSSVPDAVAFYERAQMERIADAFWYRRAR